MHLFSPRALSIPLTTQHNQARGSAAGLPQRWAPEHQVVRAKIWQQTKHFVSDLLDVLGYSRAIVPGPGFGSNWVVTGLTGLVAF